MNRKVENDQGLAGDTSRSADTGNGANGGSTGGGSELVSSEAGDESPSPSAKDAPAKAGLGLGKSGLGKKGAGSARVEGGNVGNLLRGAYRDTVDEAIPDDLMDLLNKLE